MRKYRMPTVQELMPLSVPRPLSFKGAWLAALMALLPLALFALLALFAIR